MAKGKPGDSVNGWAVAREIAGWLHGADQACALRQIDKSEQLYAQVAKKQQRKAKKRAKKG